MINFTGGEGQKWGDPLLALVEANSHSTWPLPASQGHGLEPKWLEPKRGFRAQWSSGMRLQALETRLQNFKLWSNYYDNWVSVLFCFN